MKILHVEDDATDAELMHAVFQEEWPDCQITLVCQREAFVRQLQAPHDLIISDFNMHNFDGLEALRLARDQAPTIPFIFLSGTIGEDRAVEAMRSGATDYVIKDRPKRLIPAIKRALADAQHLRERREAEEQLLRVQRLENIGMLAAGIAHDFNNVLAPVLMGVPLLRSGMREPIELSVLTNIEKSAARGAELVRQILGFAQGVTGEPQLMQPRHLLHELIGVLRQTLPASIEIEQQIDADIWPIKANPTQLHQVLLNLCVNARDAMPKGGKLRVYACNRQLDAASAAAISGAKTGPYLLFEIADTGTGIPSEVLNRIWEPFFTTKGTGRGTGLGLPTVRSIVENHQGVIALHSKVGRGTTFQVYLPAVPGQASMTGSSADTVIPRAQNELVLVADDDDNVRDVTAAILAQHGYRVLAAADGTEALALFAARSLEIRGVVTDIGMPNLDGIALTRVVHSLNPATRVLAITGSPDIAGRLRDQHFTDPVLAKPFTAHSLLAKMHELLNDGASVRASSPAAQ